MSFDRYKVLGEVGRGGVGVVYRARSPEGASVAIKVITGMDPETLARFQRERRILASFGEREGFVPLIDHGMSPRGPFLVMPFLEGGTLRKKLRERGPLPIAAIPPLALRLADSVARAHARGILHRDLKPDNILFDAEDVALVADLGLAKHFRRDVPGASQTAALTDDGTVFGTPGYMPPEQANGIGVLGPTADVFALGAIIFECLTGRRVFERLARMEQEIEASVRTLSQLRPETPEWLRRIVETSLAIDPEARFPDAAALAGALAVGETWSTRISSPAAWAGKILRSRRGRIALFVLLGAGGALVLRSVSGERPAHDTRIAELEQRLANLEQPARPDGKKPESPRSAAPVPARTSEDADALRHALLLEQNGQRAQAVLELAAIVSRTNGDGGALADLAAIQLRAGEVDAAIANATKAIEQKSDLALAWTVRAEAHVRKRNPLAAIADATRALDVERTLTLPLVHRAAARLLLHDRAGAKQDATAALTADPGLAAAWAMRAEARTEQDEAEHSIGDADTAIALDPRIASAYASRGRAEELLGHHEKAIADCTRAIEVDPRYAPAWSHRAWAKERKGDHAGALQDCAKAIELDPLRARSWSTRGWVKFNAGDLDGAIADSTKALQVDPNEDTAWRNRWWAREAKGDLENANLDKANYLELAPGAGTTAERPGAARPR